MATLSSLSTEDQLLLEQAAEVRQPQVLSATVLSDPVLRSAGWCLRLAVALHSSGCSGVHEPTSMCDAHDHGGAHPMHTDEVIATQRSLENYQILLQVKTEGTVHWQSVGSYRGMALLSEAHAEEHSSLTSLSSDILQLIYLGPDVTDTATIVPTAARVKVKYRCEHRVGHLSARVDEIESNWSNAIAISTDSRKCTTQRTEEESELKEASETGTSTILLDKTTATSSSGVDLSTSASEHMSSKTEKHSALVLYTDSSLAQLTQCAKSHFILDRLKSTSPLSDTESKRLFYPAIVADSAQNSVFIHDAFNDGKGVVSSLYRQCLGTGVKTSLPLLKVARSRCALSYVPLVPDSWRSSAAVEGAQSGALLLTGGYLYDATSDKSASLNSCEVLILDDSDFGAEAKSSGTITAAPSHWRTDLVAPMSSCRCEHSTAVVQMDSGRRVVAFSVGGDKNGMFLRSAEYLVVIADELSASESAKLRWKRTRPLKESCIRGSLLPTRSGEQLYFVGGNNGLGSSRSVQSYDVAKNQWLQLNETLFEHDDFPLLWQSAGGMLHVCGHSAALGPVETYDPRNGRWHWDCQFPVSVAADDFSISGQISRFVPF